MDSIEMSQYVDTDPHDPLSDELYNNIIYGYHCPDCQHEPMRIEFGPMGGMSRNIKCVDCNQGYNIAFMMGLAQRI